MSTLLPSPRLQSCYSGLELHSSSDRKHRLVPPAGPADIPCSDTNISTQPRELRSAVNIITAIAFVCCTLDYTPLTGNCGCFDSLIGSVKFQLCCASPTSSLSVPIPQLILFSLLGVRGKERDGVGATWRRLPALIGNRCDRQKY